MPAQATFRPPARTPHRAPPHSSQTQAGHHTKPLTIRETTTLVVEGVLIGAAVLAIFAAVYFLGNSATLFDANARFGGTAAGPPPPPSRTTVIYRDLHNGQVLVTEIDAKGTRVKGTMPKEDVPIAGNMYRDPRRMGIDPSSDATDRLNAFSQTFK